MVALETYHAAVRSAGCMVSSALVLRAAAGTATTGAGTGLRRRSMSAEKARLRRRRRAHPRQDAQAAGRASVAKAALIAQVYTQRCHQRPLELCAQVLAWRLRGRQVPRRQTISAGRRGSRRHRLSAALRGNHDRKAGFRGRHCLFRRGAFLAARSSPPFDRAWLNNESEPIWFLPICHVCRRPCTKTLRNDRTPVGRAEIPAGF